MLLVLKSWALQSELGLCSCVTLGQLLHLSELWLPHLEDGGDHHCTGECVLKELTKPTAGQSVLWGRASQPPHCPPQWPDQSLLSGTLLHVVGYLAADLASPHQRSVAPSLLATTRNVSRHPGTSAGWVGVRGAGDTVPWVRSHHWILALEKTREQGQDCGQGGWPAPARRR